MKLWLAVPFLAVAQASCYDYEYYDPTSGASLGDACGHTGTGAGVTSSGQPLGSSTSTTTTTVGLAAAPVAAGIPATATFGAPAATFGAAASFGAPAAISTYTAPVAAYTAAAPYTAPISAYTAPAAISTYTAPAAISTYTAPVAAVSTSAIVATAPVAAAVTTPAVAYSAYTPAVAAVATPVVSTTTVKAATVKPAAVQVSAAAANDPFSIQRLKAIGEDNARLHKRNQRQSRQASNDLSQASLLNRVIAGPTGTTSWYPFYRLGEQQKQANAYKSEARIADRNAHIAYQQYQANPTQLNALVSRYQDLNAQLHESAHHYNVINSGTFGQALNTGILGNLGGAALVSQVLTSQSENNDLQDIQRQMKRVARQITTVARSQSSGSTTAQAQVAAPQGSVQQRMMALSVYGPNAGRG